jgi:hypothetical protein
MSRRTFRTLTPGEVAPLFVAGIPDADTFGALARAQGGRRSDTVALGPSWPSETGGVIYEGPWLTRIEEPGGCVTWFLAEDAP